MRLGQRHVCIIILNWNRPEDTIECLESVLRLDYEPLSIVLIDNGSTDHSVEDIRKWTSSSSLAGYLEPESIHPSDGANPSALLVHRTLVFLRSAENLGFAAGSNLGIKWALCSGCEFIWLLNNDTIVAPDSLHHLVAALGKDPISQGATGQIRLYSDPSIVWNCGGDMLPIGVRRYHFAGRHISTVPQSGRRPISFMTGCAALLRTSLLRRVGLLSTKFFFGEEDFELCMRLRRLKISLTCAYAAIIYHKVGRSVQHASAYPLPKVHLYYLNRFIDMRQYWRPLLWSCWALAYSVYILLLLWCNHGLSPRQTIPTILAVLRESRVYTGVDRALFQRILAQQA